MDHCRDVVSDPQMLWSTGNHSLTHLVAELLEMSNKSMKKGATRLTPRAINLAVRADDELSTLLGGVTLSRGGVVGKVHEALQKKKKGSKKAGKKSAKKTAKK